VRRSKS